MDPKVKFFPLSTKVWGNKRGGGGGKESMEKIDSIGPYFSLFLRDLRAREETEREKNGPSSRDAGLMGGRRHARSRDVQNNNLKRIAQTSRTEIGAACGPAWV